MAVRWIDNFGWYATGQLLRYYSSKTESGTTSVGAYGPNGTSGLRMSGALGDDVTISSLPVSGQTCIVHGYVRISDDESTNVLLGFRSGGSFQCVLNRKADGTLGLYNSYPGLGGLLASSVIAIPLSEHVHLGVKVTIGSSGSVVVYMWQAGDTAPQVLINASGINTRGLGSGSWNGVHLGAATSAGTTDWSHVVIMDGSGTRNNDLFSEPISVYHYLPASAGFSSAWTPSTGTNHPALVDDPTSDDDSTYLKTATLNADELLALEPSPYLSRSAAAAALVLVAKTQGAGTGHVSPLGRFSGTTTAGSARTLTSSYLDYPTFYDAGLDGADWSVPRWNDHQWGARRNTTEADSRITQVVGLLVLLGIHGSSQGNLLTGSTHTVQGSDNLIAGDTNAVSGDTSEAHGKDGTVNGTRSVLFSQDGSPHTLSADGTVSIYADDILFNGTSVKNAITALTSDVTASGPGSVAATIANDAVTNAKAANMAQSTIKGRAASAGTGDPTDLTPDQTSTVLDGASDPFLRTSAASSGSSGVTTVRAATTANITISTALNNGDTLDGVSLVTGDHVLVKDQSAPADNGIYTVGVSPARTTGFTTYNSHAGALVTVQEGTANADTLWLGTSNVGGTINVTALAFDRAVGLRSFGLTVDAGTDPLSTGVKGFTPPMPYAGTLVGWSIVSNDSGVTSGSIVFDVWKDVFANYPPTVFDTITASAKPTITASTAAQSSTLTGWTLTFTVGDVFGFNIDSVTSLKRVTLALVAQVH